MAAKQHNIYRHMIPTSNLKSFSEAESLYRYDPDLCLADARFLITNAIKDKRWFTRNNATTKHPRDLHSKAPRATNKTTIYGIS